MDAKRLIVGIKLVVCDGKDYDPKVRSGGPRVGLLAKQIISGIGSHDGAFWQVAFIIRRQRGSVVMRTTGIRAPARQAWASVDKRGDQFWCGGRRREGSRGISLGMVSVEAEPRRVDGVQG